MAIRAEESVCKYAAVALNLPARGLDRLFDYRVPSHLQGQAVVGGRVIVPFSGRKVEGYILGFVTQPGVSEVKDILRVVDEPPVLSPGLIKLARWLSDYYLCTFAEALRCVTPTGLRAEADRMVRLAVSAEAAAQAAAALRARAPQQSAVLSLLVPEGLMSQSLLSRKLHLKAALPVLKALEEKGLVLIQEGFTPGVQPKHVRIIVPTIAPDDLLVRLAQLRSRAPRQAIVLEVLVQHPDGLSAGDIFRLTGAASAMVRSLQDKGLVQVREVELRRDPLQNKHYPQDAPPVPTPEQAIALTEINKLLAAGQPATVLLHGVTGSGKTEVYLQAIGYVLQQDRQAIVLVPEISLTPQTVERFKARFGEAVAVLHSRLSLGERYDEWRRIRNGSVSLVVGARSAVFAPFARLGLIVIDEEHETSYKQSDSPRYHARDVAMVRATNENAVVILGSATPSVESYYRAVTGQSQLVSLTRRIENRPMPPVEVVDMREELKAGNKNPFSVRLREELGACLQAGKQAIIFLNRRGFSTFILCRECGLVLRCPRCDVSLTYHADSRQLLCHYCNYSQSIPETCPRCRSHYIRYFGIGTERVEEELKILFPAARILRMDMDTTSQKGSHEKILSAFRNQKADILVGTQMIAKGLDFPQVALVGVITADTALHLPDFASGERTFQLLTQVAGRAGRSEAGGKVVIQTYNPEHYSVAAAREHDYTGFYQQEISYRAELQYPPFSRLISVLFTSTVEERVIAAAGQWERYLREQICEGAAVQVLGPVPAMLKKLNGRYRWQIVLKGGNLDTLRDLTRISRQRADDDAIFAGVGISIDIEPVGMV